jgi:hypothetical protein
MGFQLFMTTYLYLWLDKNRLSENMYTLFKIRLVNEYVIVAYHHETWHMQYKLRTFYCGNIKFAC